MYHTPSQEMLIFPFIREKQNGNIKRVSEQEARFAFCSVLEKSGQTDLCYAAEVPTKLRYSFHPKEKQKYQDYPEVYLNVKSGKSAQVDLALFNKNSLVEPEWNIEFKSGQPDPEEMKKDLLKLYFEAKKSVFFHVLENKDGGTIRALISKINDALDHVKKKAEQKEKEGQPHFNNYKLFIIIIILGSKERYIGRHDWGACIPNNLSFELIK